MLTLPARKTSARIGVSRPHYQPLIDARDTPWLEVYVNYARRDSNPQPMVPKTILAFSTIVSLRRKLFASKQLATFPYSSNVH